MRSDVGSTTRKGEITSGDPDLHDRTPLKEESARRTTHNNYKSCPLRDPNPRSQQSSGRRPTP